ncbi:hypothetical protein E2C01_089387 [Portunus trituberculatus]|uniref:Uncharacterized protein n=1 Tax=Portunus trituberculatus TaxID=210409 RepID=A0A5B7JM90_PORTR|nr:hypothetical protein [Portunus trituberculatus]
MQTSAKDALGTYRTSTPRWSTCSGAGPSSCSSWASS